MSVIEAARTTRSATRGYAVLFAIPFQAVMTERVRELLRSQLGMTLHFDRKPASALQGPGFVRLDFSSGLLLLPAGADDEWVVECRSSDPPAVDVVHGWEVDAAAVLQLIDRSVPMPAALPRCS